MQISRINELFPSFYSTARRKFWRYARIIYGLISWYLKNTRNPARSDFHQFEWARNPPGKLNLWFLACSTWSIIYYTLFLSIKPMTHSNSMYSSLITHEQLFRIFRFHIPTCKSAVVPHGLSPSVPYLKAYDKALEYSFMVYRIL